MTRVGKGFLVLTGPAADRVGEADVFFWPDDGAAVRKLALLGGLPAEAKPEALLVLEESDAAYRILVLSDSVSGGHPVEYRLRKQPH